MKHTLFIALLLLLMVGSAWAKPPSITNSTAGSFTVEITFPAGDTSDTDLIPRGGYCTVSVIIAGSDVVELYQVPLSTTAASAGTIVGSAFSATTTAVTTVQPSQLGFKARATTAGTGGSKMIIKCSNTQLTEGAGGDEVTPPTNADRTIDLADYTFQQTAYADGHPSISNLEFVGMSVDMHLPIAGHVGGGLKNNNMGVGFTMPDNDAGSGVEANLEPDATMGFWYNGKAGPSLVPSNYFEHAFTWRAETNYKSTSGTAGRTWVEWNKDLYPPDLSCEMNAFTANETAFATDIGAEGAKEPLTWSGGGTAWGLDYDTGTNVLKFRMDNNTVVAANETVTVTAGGATATCDGEDMVYLGANAGHIFRPEQFVWDSYNGSNSWTFTSGPTAAGGISTERRPHAALMRLQDEGVNINGPSGSGVPPGLSVYNQYAAGSAIAALNVYSTHEGTDGAGATNSNKGIAIKMDFSGDDHEYNQNIHIDLLGPGPGETIHADSTVTEPNAIRIRDQEGYDTTNASVIRIDAQTCAAGGGVSACSTGSSGNLSFAGGTWNTGHIVLGGTGYGLHIYADDAYNTMKIVGDNFPYSAALTQGVAVVTGSNLATHGPAMWGISNAGTVSNGNELCGWVGTGQLGGVGMTCQDVLEFSTVGTPTDSACATDHANGVKFLAMCK